LVPATALAAGNSLRLSPASSSVGNGATFTVHVIGNSAGAVSGTSASVTFDKTKLQVTAIVKGTDWVNGGAGWAGYPTSANLATFLANANSAGKIPSIAAFFLSGSLPAGDHTLFTVTFHAIATGSAVVNLPIGPSDGGMLDGSVATYGNALTVTAASPAGTYTINPVLKASISALSTWYASAALTIHWTGTPGAFPIANYDVRYRKAAWNSSTFSAFTTWRSATTATSASIAVSSGYTYCFSARVRDAHGAVSAYTAETCTAIPLDDRSLTRSGTWTLGTGTAYYRGTYVRSTSTVASLTRTTVHAKRLAIVATTCTTCGSVKVYWNGVLIKTQSLYSATTVNKRLLTVVVWTSIHIGTLAIKPATSGKASIIDGVAIRVN
jgi:hypothetical protein